MLLVVLGGLALLTLFTVQNWSVIPPLPLAFLGIKTQSLPLSVWILIATVAGAIAYELIASLLRLPNFRESQGTFKSSSTRRTKPSTHNYSQRYSSAQTESRSRPVSDPQPKSAPRNKTQEYDDYREYDDYDDWENAGKVDDWNFEDEREEASGYYRDTEVRNPNPPQSNRSTTNRSTTNRSTTNRSTTNRSTKSNDYSDSSYSYDSSEAKNSGVEKTESVYDADYRVINSPYKPSSTNQFDEEKNRQDDYDEWDFLEDDDFEVEDKRPRK